MYRYVTLTIVLAISTAAGAQITWDPNSASKTNYLWANADLTWGGTLPPTTITVQPDGFDLVTDGTLVPDYPYPDANGSAQWGLAGQMAFSVGPVPVSAALTMSVNGKLVNGGGSDTDPYTILQWGSEIYYDLDENGFYSPGDAAVPHFSLLSGKTLHGNGYEIVDRSLTTLSYVLSPEYSYVMRYYQTVTMSGFGEGPATATFEGGAETAYDGISMTLLTTPVPEPATIGLLAMGGLALLRRRKK